MPENDHDVIQQPNLQQSLIEIATESWRVSHVFERVLQKLDAGERKRYHSQFMWFHKKVMSALEKSDLRIENITGQMYDPGMAASPVNLDDFDSEDKLLVDQMLEPVIMGKDGLVKMGTITLRKIES